MMNPGWMQLNRQRTSQMQWDTPETLEPQKQRNMDKKDEASLGYTVRPYLGQDSLNIKNGFSVKLVKEMTADICFFFVSLVLFCYV